MCGRHACRRMCGRICRYSLIKFHDFREKIIQVSENSRYLKITIGILLTIVLIQNLFRSQSDIEDSIKLCREKSLNPDSTLFNFPVCSSSGNTVYGRRFDYTWMQVLKDLQLLDLPKTYTPFIGLTVKEHPPFVTSCSSNHYKELLGYIVNLQTVFKNFRLIVFDIGLSKTERENVEKTCNVEVRSFPFHKYPEYVKNLRTYRWKSLVIAEMLKELDVFWYTDGSIRWEKNDFYEEAYGSLNCDSEGNCLNRLSSYRLHDNGGNALFRTDPVVYNYLPVNRIALLENHVDMYGGGFAFVVKAKLTMAVVKWYVLCSLQKYCMDVPESVLSEGIPKDISLSWSYSLGLPGRSYKWSGNHRFDQSVVNLILSELNNYNETQYTLPLPFVTVQRESQAKGIIQYCHNTSMALIKKLLDN